MTKIKDLNAQMLFKLPPEKAVKYMQSKGYKITNDWREMWEDAHAKAFTISKMTDATLLKESRDIIEKAISEGWSSSKAEKELTNLYKSKQWWGKKVITDKDGNEKEIQLGSPSRVRTIFRTNLQAAYSAQNYLRQLEDVDFAPYWQYIAVMDNRTRPAHAALHEKVFRYDDPFWDKFYPPNGFGCRCTVRNLTESQMKSLGVKEETSDGKLTTEKINVGTPDSEVGQTVPDNNIKEISVFKQDMGGYFQTTKTDAGWNYNVGKSAWNIDVLAYKEIAQLPTPIQDRFISDMAQNRHRKDDILLMITNFLNKKYKQTPKELPITWLSPVVIKFLNKHNTKPITPVIALERGQTTHSLRISKSEKQKLSKDQYYNIYDFLNEPDAIYLDTSKKQLLFVKFLPKDEIVDDRDCIKVPVIINSKNKKRPINYIGTTGRVNHDNTFKNPIYKKIE